MKSRFSLTIATVIASTNAFTLSPYVSPNIIHSPALTAPASNSAARIQRENKTSLNMIDSFISGIFGKKEAEITDTVFFDIDIDGEKGGRIEMGLYGSVVPKTTENFKQLCTGQKGFG